MRITQEEKEARKKRIVHMAYELFCQRGIERVSLKEIAKSAGVSLNSIFRYFDTKTTLLYFTQEILWEEIVAQIQADSSVQLAQTRNGLEEMGILLSRFQGLYECYSSYILFACEYKLYLIRQGIRLQEGLYNETMSPVYQVFMAALTRGQRDGSISACESPEIQFQTIWNLLRSLVEGIAVHDRVCEEKNYLKDSFPHILQQVLESLCAKAQTGKEV